MLGHRVKETTTTTGTGALSLDGTVGSGFLAFSSEFADGAKVIYGIAAVDTNGNGNFEIVIGTLTHGTPDTLTRDTVIRSTNANNKVNWGPGTKFVFSDISAYFTPVERTAESVACAATIALDAVAGNFVHATGSTGPVTSFGTARAAGRRVTVVWDSTPTINNGPNLVIPGGANVTVSAGDIWIVRADTATKWVVENWLCAATQAEMEAATSLAKPVTPGRMQYHPGVAKAWITFDGTSASIGSGLASYNIASVTDNGVGDYTINIGTDFSSANYCVTGMARLALGFGGFLQGPANSAPAAGSYRVGTTNTSHALADCAFVNVVFFGDQ